jgi:hypothetical protein
VLWYAQVQRAGVDKASHGHLHPSAGVAKLEFRVSTPHTT